MNKKSNLIGSDLMKYGIYYAYWEQEWKADYKSYIEKAAKLGFDILEIAASPIPFYSEKEMMELKACAAGNGIVLTAGHGPNASQNLSSSDPNVRANAKLFFTDLLKRLNKMDIHLIGGALYSYWPVDYSLPIDKKGDLERSIESVREIAKVAEDCGVDFCLEVLNRFENYLINTAEEGVNFAKQVDNPRVKVMLDTFHMNIEEDSIGGAIRKAGDYLGHFHTGECNRKVPGTGRIPWKEIGEALNDIGYDKAIVMEPFVKMGGTVGSDIKVWRDISCGADEAELDRAARNGVNFSRYILENR
jgi:D-psicose/D-tagatose/L-ribulose 3-epimerase